MAGANTYGYVRVSTKEQNEARQMAAMREFGIDDQNIIVEKLSGKDFNRPEYRRLVKTMKAGDTLVVKSIDRLGRNYREVLEEWGRLTRTCGVSIVVLDMPLLDTRDKQDLMGTLISDIVLQLLSYVAETERENIRARQAEGIAAAKARGVRFGPAPMEMPEGFEYMAMLWHEGKVSARKAGRTLGISGDTFSKRAREYAMSELPVKPLR